MKKNRQAELIKSLTKQELVYHLYFTQIIILTIAGLLSFIFFNSYASYFKLFSWDTGWIIIGIVNGLIIVALDLVLMKLLPKQYYDDGGINEKLFSNMPIWKIAFVAILIAVAEETLFRGIIQTKMGLVIASIVFAVIHIRYWAHWFLILNVVILSFWIGILYEWSGQQLLPVIAMHFTIDFLLGLYISRTASQNNHKEGI
ncbi:CPBP family intramembrane glutamic endopeptidase [Lederbergia citrea]|uniref:CPBP family intramembrane metalloprotease n=1 Tax=Lederbergia citrea TaxID=2833581 RepID=A0A942UP41_9BACI|nr:CPBP family intramembrane glutamic endopeptidase [Lederbergia citrea]MBS4222288.1 CPBP family intramembrane metalloprotease [Lederbergia citrea]